MLVQLKNLTKSFGSQTVLDKINLTVNEKDRLGIVGVNGAGKTTLFNIIAGALEAEAYENATDAVYVRKGLKIGYLRQVEAVESQNTLYGEIRRSFAEIDRIAAQLEALTEKISCAKPDSAEYAGLAEKVAAVAIHNIPEGIAVSTPVFFATGSRSKAFWYSFLSGLAEPLGAIAGYLMLMPILNETVFGVLYGAVAGIMLYIALAELLPSAHEQSPKKFAVNAGLVAGMLIMAISLILFM